jgi:Mrp family chromosome partitioning ATPase/capsular polysaccharide biosynthesis protein
MSAWEVWTLFRRRWWVIAMVAVVGALSALLYSLAQPPLYRAHAEVVVLPSRADYGLGMFLEARMRSYRAVLLSIPKTSSDLPSDLSDRMYVQLVPDEGRIVIEVDDRDAQQAARLAGALAKRLQEWVDQNPPQAGFDRLYVQSLAPVEVPTAPSSPRYKVNTLAGAVLGLALGLPLAFLWDFLDDTLDEPVRAAARLGIAVWPALPPFPDDAVPPLSDPSGEVAAAYHRLHTYLRLARAEPWHALAVVGAAPGGLPPALVADLGVAMAQEGARVLLVDADLGRPALHSLFALPPAPGLGDLLQQEAGAVLPRAETPQAGLALLPAGEPLPPASQAVVLHRLVRALPGLAVAGQDLLLRLPDPLVVPESLFLAAWADAVLLVAPAGRARARDVRRVIQSLQQANARVLGLALWRQRRAR